MTLAELNALDQARFVALLGAVCEHSPWVAERAWRHRPFSSPENLFQVMLEEVKKATREEQLTLIRAHPELAGREDLTENSAGEQGRLGLLNLSKPEFQLLAGINRRYREKFGFPCIVALRLHASRASVIEEMERRTGNDAASEHAAALEQIAHIARGRLEKLIEDGQAHHARS